MIGNGSLLSSLTGVRGLELITPSILMRGVFSSLKERSALPKTLRSGSLAALQKSFPPSASPWRAFCDESPLNSFS